MEQEQVDARVRKMEQDWERRDRLYQEQLEAYVAMAKALECEVCSIHGQRSLLAGGRSVALCNIHRNAWAEFFSSHNLSGWYMEVQAEYSVAVSRGLEDIAKQRTSTCKTVIEQIYDLSGEWLKEEKMKWQV